MTVVLGNAHYLVQDRAHLRTDGDEVLGLRKVVLVVLIQNLLGHLGPLTAADDLLSRHQIAFHIRRQASDDLEVELIVFLQIAVGAPDVQVLGGGFGDVQSDVVVTDEVGEYDRAARLRGHDAKGLRARYVRAVDDHVHEGRPFELLQALGRPHDVDVAYLVEDFLLYFLDPRALHVHRRVSVQNAVNFRFRPRRVPDGIRLK